MPQALRKVIFLLLGAVFWPIPGRGAPAAASRPGWSLDFNPHLSPLGIVPEWSQLDRWQDTISKETFVKTLQDVYSSRLGGWDQWVKVGEGGAEIVMDAGDPARTYRLRFAPTDQPLPVRAWRSPGELGPAADAARPLAGVRIAIDPGHIGGPWARLEQRIFQIGTDPPVQEGNLTLATARRLEVRLRQAGAEVVMLRRWLRPVSPLRPLALTGYARALLKEAGLADPPLAVLERTRNHIFSVNAEIRARAARANNTVRPDLVLCLHFNAEPWGSVDSPTFSDKNHLHALVDGCVLPEEWAHDDERFETLARLLQRTHEVEHGLAAAVAASLATATGLPAFEYLGPNARATSVSKYVWARNLLATRLYQCPVVFLEPHVMNHQLTYERIQAGGYQGQRKIGGVARANLFDEYADATATAVAAWYAAQRPPRMTNDE